MTSEIVVALLALVGTLGGSAGGVLAAGKMTNFRLQQLESRVAEHNGYAHRLPVVEEQIRVLDRRLERLERG